MKAQDAHKALDADAEARMKGLLTTLFTELVDATSGEKLQGSQTPQEIIARYHQTVARHDEAHQITSAFIDQVFKE